MPASRRLSVLTDYGLKETEAKAYLALLEHSCLGAAALGEAANVPRSHLYKVLQDLHSYGLVDVLLREDARVYRARPFSAYLERRASELRERLARMEEDIRTLGDAFVPPPMENESAAVGDIRLMVGRRAVSREIDSLLSAATSEVLLACSDTTRARLARHLRTAWEAWREQAAWPRVTVILPLGMAIDGDLALALNGRSVEVRMFAMHRPMLSFVADHARMVLVHPMPDTSAGGNGRDFALFSDDPAFVQGHAALLLAGSQPARAPRSTHEAPSS